MFFAMHNASFDAGIVAWHIKRKYNGVRPITAVRLSMQGRRSRVGGPGRPIERIPGEKWSPYNPGTNLTPSFPGYFSGHSVFSRSSATVLSLFTGDDHFGFSTVLPPNFGRVEPGIPTEPTTFSYETFSDAAQEAGLSRLYGGIHFSDDNTTAQRRSALIGVQAWVKARRISAERRRKLGSDCEPTIDMVRRQGATSTRARHLTPRLEERRWIAVCFFHALTYTTSKSSMT